MEIPEGGRSNTKPSGTENPVGWGVKLEKTLRGGGGGWIFSGTTHLHLKVLGKRLGILFNRRGNKLLRNCHLLGIL